MATIIYKILTGEQWARAKEAGVFRGAPVDLRDGYLHFSAAHQLGETARLYFSGMNDLILLSVDAERLGSQLKWEDSRGGEQFPHYYGHLPLDEILLAAPLPLDESGRHVLPPDIPK